MFMLKADPFFKKIKINDGHFVIALGDPFYCSVKMSFNYQVFELEDDLLGRPHTWYLSSKAIHNTIV